MKKFFGLSLVLASLCMFSLGCEPGEKPDVDGGDANATGEHDHEHADGEDHDHGDEEEGEHSEEEEGVSG